MKILIDECLPRKLKNELIGHKVKTVPEMGWSGKKNGELLTLMLDAFEVFITIDNNLEHQQQLQELPISFIVFSAKSNTLAVLKPLMPAVRMALETIQLGELVIIRSEATQDDQQAKEA